MKILLCEKCGRPLWEELCAYCRGYLNGVKDTKKRKIDTRIVSIETLTLKEGDIFPSVEGVKDNLVDYRLKSK